MKLLLTAVLLFSVSTIGLSQTVTAEYEPEHQSNSTSEFPLKQGVLTASQSSYSFGSGSSAKEIFTPIAVGLSDDRTAFGTIRFDRTLNSEIYHYSGHKLLKKELEFVDASDETIMLSVLDNGEFVVRDNVANFTFFDAAGNEGYSLSNATQAPGGEHPSGISSSSSGATMVLYNPVIQYENTQGSRASIAVGDREGQEFYSSSTHTISHLEVSKNGNFVTIGSSGGSENSQVLLFDRFGNELFNMELDMDLEGLSLTNDARYLTVYSVNRVQVYRTSDRERLGSSTSTTRIIHAAYQPDESTIISIGGQVRNGNVNNPEITAINLDQRQLDRYQLNGTIAMLNQSDIKIIRLRAGEYRVEGINKPIVVRATF